MQVSELEETKMQDNFQQLSIQSRIDLLNLYSLTSIEYLRKFVNMNDKISQETTEQVCRTHGEAKETIRMVKKVRKESKICKQKENLYGAVRLAKDVGMFSFNFLMAGNGLNTILCFIQVLEHFDSEILQNQYDQIQKFNLVDARLLMVLLTLINFIVTSFFSSQSTKLSGVRKSLLSCHSVKKQ